MPGGGSYNGAFFFWIRCGQLVGKILFILVLALVGYALWRGLKAKARQADQAPAVDASGPRSKKSVEDMVRCSRCGVHVPTGEALLTDGRYFCTADHAKEPRS